MDRARSGATAASAIGIALILASCGASFATPAPSTQATGGAVPPTGPVPSASAVATPTAAPTRPPQLGLAWTVVDDRDLATYPNVGVMHGVIAGGSGAIAWGETWGPAAANGALPALGPKIWTTADGRDWVSASVEAPIDAHSAYPGSVLDIAAGGPGYVAAGSYYRTGRGLVTAVWTSTDARIWRLNHDDPALDESLVNQVLPWKGELLAIGCEKVSATDCGDTRVWTSSDGVRWAKVGTNLKPGIQALWLAASTDRLWAFGLNADEGMMLASTPPPLLTSVDARAWETSPLPMLGVGRVHPLATGLYYTLVEVPPDDQGPGSPTHPTWISRTPGVYRSTDLVAWEPIAVGRQLGEEIVAFGDTLVMVGANGKQCWNPAGCIAAAWRSTDEGRTWQAAPVTGSTPKDRPGGTIDAVAALPDGTLVGVGKLYGKDGWTSTATWVSPSQPGP